MEALDAGTGGGRFSGQPGARFRRLLAVLDLLEIPDGLGPSISLVSALAGGRTPPSFSPGSLMERVKDRIGGLAQDCRRQDLGSIMLRGREVVGLGPGLTPSGDDFLGALLFAAHCLQRAYPINFPRTEADRYRDFWSGPGPAPIRSVMPSSATWSWAMGPKRCTSLSIPSSGEERIPFRP